METQKAFLKQFSYKGKQIFKGANQKERPSTTAFLNLWNPMLKIDLSALFQFVCICFTERRAVGCSVNLSSLRVFRKCIDGSLKGLQSLKKVPLSQKDDPKKHGNGA